MLSWPQLWSQVIDFEATGKVSPDILLLTFRIKKAWFHWWSPIFSPQIFPQGLIFDYVESNFDEEREDE